MLRCLSGIIGYRIGAMDGVIGKVHDFLVDDPNWTVRYVVVERALNSRRADGCSSAPL